MNYKKGDIVIVKFPFILNQRTEKQKGRPALVISNERVERRYKDLLLAAITSNIQSSRGDCGFIFILPRDESRGYCHVCPRRGIRLN